jgi:hypothetical protein
MNRKTRVASESGTGKPQAQLKAIARCELHILFDTEFPRDVPSSASYANSGRLTGKPDVIRRACNVSFKVK